MCTLHYHLPFLTSEFGQNTLMFQHTKPHMIITYSLLIKCSSCITHIFVKLFQGLGFYLSMHLGFILAIRPVIKIFLLVKLWDLSQVSGLENAVAGNSPENGFHGFKILVWWESDAGLKSRYHLSPPLEMCVSVSVCIHTCTYTFFTHGHCYCIQIIFQVFWLGFLITLTMTQKMVLCGQLQEKGPPVINISVKNSKFELHVALGLLFLFGFSKSSLWQARYIMHKSDIEEILVTKTCSQKNVKYDWDPKRLAESQTSANLVQSLTYSEQGYDLNWFHIKYLPFWSFYPETHDRFWVWILSLAEDRCQKVLLQEALQHTCLQVAFTPGPQKIQLELPRKSQWWEKSMLNTRSLLSLFHFKGKRGGNMPI